MFVRLPALVCASLLTLASSPALGQCSLGFEGRSYPMGAITGDALLLDLDNDGVVDLACATAAGLTVRAGVIEKDLAGLALYPSTPVASLAGGDFDGDGRIDVAAACQDAALVAWAGAAPNLANAVTLPITSTPGRLIAAPLDRDAADELVVLLPKEREVAVVVGGLLSGAATLSRTAVNGIPNDAVAADLDGDGAMDVAVAEIDQPALRVLLGDGAGGLSPTAWTPLSFGSHVVAALDADLDGILDLATVNDDFDDGQITIHTGDGFGRFHTAWQSPTITTANRVTARDLDLDGRHDLVISSALQPRIAVHLAVDGGFPMAQSIPLSEASGIAIGDLVGDEALDLVVTRAGADDAVVWTGDAAGFASLLNATLDGQVVVDAIADDVDGDGATDIVVATSGAAVLGHVLRVESGHLVDEHTFSVDGGLAANVVASGDLNSDGTTDVLFGMGQAGFAIFLADGAGGFLDPTVLGVVANDPAELADVDLDGDLDLLTPDTSGLKVLHGDGQGGFLGAITVAKRLTFGDAVIEDFDQNGWPDVAAGVQIGGVLLNGPITADSQTPFTALPLVDLTMTQLNGDANPDLLAITASGDAVAFMATANGFDLAAQIPLADGPRAIIDADLDGDGDRDAIIRYDHRMSTLLGDGTGAFVDANASFALPEHGGLLIGDYDHNGLMDVFSGTEMPAVSLNVAPQGWPFYYGSGKPGSAGVPLLTTSGSLAIGGTATLTISQGTTGLEPILILGTKPTELPFDHGSLLVEGGIALPLAPFDPAGQCGFTIAIPDQASLCGFVAYFQVMFVDPGAAGSMHTAQSGGLGWVVGS